MKQFSIEGRKSSVDSLAHLSEGSINETSSEVTLELYSSSDDDAAGGTGARSVRIYYLNAEGREKFVDVVPTGTTRVQNIVDDFKDLLYMELLSVGSGGVAAGEIIIDDGSTEYGNIQASENKSFNGIITVPKSSKARWNVEKFYGGMETAVDGLATIILQVKRNSAWVDVKRVSVRGDDGTPFANCKMEPVRLEHGDKVRVVGKSTTSGTLYGGFDLVESQY